METIFSQYPLTEEAMSTRLGDLTVAQFMSAFHWNAQNFMNVCNVARLRHEVTPVSKKEQENAVLRYYKSPPGNYDDFIKVNTYTHCTHTSHAHTLC
jgi:hypothetical protein